MANSAFITPGGVTNNGTNIVLPVNVPLDYQATGLATTSTDGMIVENTTLATAAIPVQISPRIRWAGAAWNSVGLVSEADLFFAECLPATVAGTTTAKWRLGSTIAGGALSYLMELGTNGVLTLLQNGLTVAAGSIGLPSAGQLQFSARSTLASPADSQFNIANAAASAGIGFDVSTDGTLKGRNRAQSAYGTTDWGTYKVNGVVFPTATVGPASPTGTTSTTLVMAGLAGAITTQTGRVVLTMSGYLTDSAANDGTKAQISYGTGTAPVNGAALTGTQVGPVVQFNASTLAAGASAPYAATWIVTGLTLNTAYWFDTAFAAITGGTGSLVQATMTAQDIP